MIDIDKLTLGEALEVRARLEKLGGAVALTSVINNKARPRIEERERDVIVRAYSGVFFGTIVARRVFGGLVEVDLKNYRHIHVWKSSGSLSFPRKVLNVEDLALLGANTDTTISGECAFGTVSDVKQFVDCSLEASKILRGLPCRA